MEMLVKIRYKPHNNISEKNISFYELKKRYSPEGNVSLNVAQIHSS